VLPWSPPGSRLAPPLVGDWDAFALRGFCLAFPLTTSAAGAHALLGKRCGFVKVAQGWSLRRQRFQPLAYERHRDGALRPIKNMNPGRQWRAGYLGAAGRSLAANAR
jgi:hypothetical protein